ncbi:MAG: Carbon monoxide oxidation accessory protein CoxD, partial [uncultured Solirubrobacteraceae bacterium]
WPARSRRPRAPSSCACSATRASTSTTRSTTGTTRASSWPCGPRSS